MSERDTRWRAFVSAVLLAVVATCAGAVAAGGTAAPTGRPVTDAVLVGLGVAAVVVVGSRAPWWLVAAAGVVASVIAVDPLLAGVAGVAVAAALMAGTRPHPPAVLLAVSLGVTFNVAARAELDGPLGTSALVSVAMALVLYVAGGRAQPRRLRRLSWAGLGALVVFAGGATLAFGLATASSRHDLASGLAAAELGMADVEAGHFEEATSRFAEAATHLDAASDDLGRPWVRLAGVVPVVAQHEAAAREMSRAGADGARAVVAALDRVDLGALRPEGGRFDLAALADLERPLREVRAALVRLRESSVSVSSPWLVPRARVELDDVATTVDTHLPDLDQALEAVRAAPAMLGGDGPRTYLLLFTTPAEARGLGGFIGSIAELRIEDGRVALGDLTRATDLDHRLQELAATVRGNDEFLRQYGRFGYDADNTGSGLVSDAAFRNLALSPDFPTVAQIARDLYAQATGRRVDGVIAMDPFVITALLRYTGPVSLTSLAQEVAPDAVLDFLLRDQYVVAPDIETRVDGLAEAASQAFDGLVGGALPSPVQLAHDLGPLTAARRLLVWSADRGEQALLETGGVAGAIPALDDADGWSFTVSNAGGSKIDSFLERRAGYTSSLDPSTGVTVGTLHVELSNHAPDGGLPDYVIGNFLDKPTGTSTLLVTMYSALGMERLTLDGEVVGFEVGQEQGWNTYRLTIDIPPGQTVRLDADLTGTVERPGELITWTQPLANELQAI